MSAVSAWRQLPLPFVHAPQFVGAEFLAAASNAEALAWLDRTAHWPQHRLALWGGEGGGKTHLLYRWAARNGAGVLPGPALRFDPLSPPGERRPMAIDEADTAPERPLLHLLNAAAEADLPVLLASRTPPGRWRVGLPDLASRLRAVTAVQIHPAEDELLRSLLARLLAERQMAVPAALQDWLRLRLPRTPGAMREIAARLDRAALASGGRVTRPLAAAVLSELDLAVPGGGDGPRAAFRGTYEDLAQSPATGSAPSPDLL